MECKSPVWALIPPQSQIPTSKARITPELWTFRGEGAGLWIPWVSIYDKGAPLPTPPEPGIESQEGGK